MKMYIPTCGDIIRLTADWTFDLHNESRNHSLMTYVNDPRIKMSRYNIGRNELLPCTIPAGAELKIDRIYIRKNNNEDDSISFLWKGVSNPARFEMQDRSSTEYFGCNNGIPPVTKKWQEEVRIPKEPIRFWAKLVDVNNIEFEQV